MDVELVTDEISEDEIYGVDDYSEDYLNYEGERCGICMDVVIDRGVLDCCQHWFCFACIDNWATITSLCPLCQNEFQLITCVPVYDTVGGNKTDDETNPRDDEWFIEGKTNTLSFPSYYIDENAVVCLDGDDCKIRSGSVAIEEDSDIDTSIACDSCDKWYHAYCVGFDPEGTCDTSWLCPRCTAVKDPERSDRVSILKKSNENGLELTGGDFQAEASFSGRVSVSVADDGETAVVISLIEGNQDSLESGESAVRCSNAMENTFLSSSTSNKPNSEAPPSYTNSLEPNLCQQEMGLSLPRDNGYTSSHSLSPAELKVSVDDAVERAPRQLNNKMTDTGLGLDVGLTMVSETPDMKNNDLAEDHEAGSLEPNNRPEVLLPAENVMCNDMEVSIQSMTHDEKETMNGTSGAKRKHEDSSCAEGGEREVHNDDKSSRKKIKAERDRQPSSLTDQTAVSSLDDSNKVCSRSNLRGSTYKSTSEKEHGTVDIMDIIQETDRRSLKQLKHLNSSNRSPKERESAAGLRLKKIMRRPGDNKDSFELVQELRKKIRETVRNKSSKELGQKVFDPELLNAFRAALTGPGDENRKPTVDVKAKRSLLQKGKVRESLTKKIYGTGGKRKRAWTRECEVEFWKHRCMKTSKPEKIQMLKSVLDLLKDNSDDTDKMPGNEQETKGSILSRLYLADSSVLPRKNDIQPVSALKDVATPEQEKHDGLTENTSTLWPNNKSNGNPQKHNASPQVNVPPLESKETKKITKGVRSETALSGAQPKKHLKGAPSEKDVASKPDMINGDKRKWALELLARKTASSGKNMQEKEEDNKIFKGNYALLARLPKEMRPVLAPSCHNKIPMSVRQVQLYRLTEHFLKKANLPVVCRSAEMELAVADAVNIEKGIADRSKSKLVYLNLCSQELLRRSDDVNNDRAKEVNACSTSECISDGASKETNNCFLDLEVDEALRKAGLMSDSPPNSPDHPTEDIHYRVGSVEDSDDEGPNNVIEVDSHPDLDIYGDFEYNLEDDDFIGAGALHITKLEAEEPKMKVLFSSLKLETSSGIEDPPDHEVGIKALGSPSDLLEAQNKTSIEGSTVDSGGNEHLVRNSSYDNDEDAECEELYGPDKEPIIEKYPEIASVTPFILMVNNELHGENGDYRSKNSEPPSAEDHTDNLEAVTDESKQLPSDSEKREHEQKKEINSKCDTKQPEHHSTVMKKVEAYIKEHIRPLCKSGVITVEQYRWAVGKTTEKVMKYHSKEKSANFLIKEGEKVKKLAEQYVETAQKTKT